MSDDFYCDEALSGNTKINIVIETDDVLAFHHTRPYWPVHIVVIPKMHVPSLIDLGPAGESILPALLAVVFDRLYVLRNQIIHGGSTWNSSVNRRQVQDGVSVLSWLLPIFIDIMMDNPKQDWGKPFYPVVEPGA